MAGEQKDTSRGSATASAPAAASSSRSRRALGDVSNKESTDNRENVAKKQEIQTLRRSRRLSNGAAASAEQSQIAEEIEAAVPKRQSLRVATQARVDSNPLVEPQPKGKTAHRRSLKAEIEDSKQPARERKPKAKIVTTSKDETAPPRKRTRRSRSNSQAEAQNPQPVLVPFTTGKKPHPVLVPLTTGKNPCRDLLPTTDHKLEREAFRAWEFTQGISSYDARDADDAQYVVKYVTDFYQRLYAAEETTRPRPYMAGQPHLNSMMRSILVDWLIEVHMKFRLLPETLYLCINIIDRYLNRKQISRARLQLVGVTGLLIACKYEEICPPEVKDCVYITDRAYTRQDVLDMEADIVKTLDFSLTVPTGHPFLQRFLYITESSELVRNLANFYMERMLLEHGALAFKPSLLAAAAVCLASSNPDRLDCEGFSEEDQEKFPPTLLDYTGFTEADIIAAATLIEEKIAEVNATPRSRSLVAVKRKYESNRYNQVSSNFTPPRALHLSHH